MAQRRSREAMRAQLRAAAASLRATARTGFGLTPREREGLMLVAALFVLGLAVRWLRWCFAG